jgi:hypothetical protein
MMCSWGLIRRARYQADGKNGIESRGKIATRELRDKYQMNPWGELRLSRIVILRQSLAPWLAMIGWLN